MGCLFLDSQRIEPAVMNAFSYQWRFPDLERALRDIEGRELPEDKVDCEDVADS
jgi:NAD dependent epimerase/dehydratase family enzyme